MRKEAKKVEKHLNLDLLTIIAFIIAIAISFVGRSRKLGSWLSLRLVVVEVMCLAEMGHVRGL